MQTIGGREFENNSLIVLPLERNCAHLSLMDGGPRHVSNNNFYSRRV